MISQCTFQYSPLDEKDLAVLVRGRDGRPAHHEVQLVLVELRALPVRVRPRLGRAALDREEVPGQDPEPAAVDGLRLGEVGAEEAVWRRNLRFDGCK